MAMRPALCAVLFLTACGASTSGSGMRVSESEARLTGLLQANGVTESDTPPTPLAAAWKAFTKFAALDVFDGTLPLGYEVRQESAE
jgi:hypothetical protein